MADNVSRAKRSWIMAQVRSRGNESTELKVVKILKKEGLKGWRRGFPLLGKPDFVYPKKKIAVFIDGCFWHGCPRCCRMPSVNRAYWKKKIERNKARDKKVSNLLKNQEWLVIRMWEHEINAAAMRRKLSVIKRALEK